MVGWAVDDVGGAVVGVDSVGVGLVVIVVVVFVVVLIGEVAGELGLGALGVGGVVAVVGIRRVGIGGIASDVFDVVHVRGEEETLTLDFDRD